MRTLSRSKKKGLKYNQLKKSNKNTDNERKEISDFINKQQEKVRTEKKEKKRDKQHAGVMI
jgi:hypothetical protein